MPIEHPLTNVIFIIDHIANLKQLTNHGAFHLSAQLIAYLRVQLIFLLDQRRNFRLFQWMDLKSIIKEYLLNVESIN